jgi:IS30 family transposase
VNGLSIHVLRAGSNVGNAARRTLSLTVDNGTEFHGYKKLEKAIGAKVYFATPHHSWDQARLRTRTDSSVSTC